MTKPTDLVQGTLDLLIMRTIASEELYGWAIAQRIQLLSNDVLQVNQGSLYPALQRLHRVARHRASVAADTTFPGLAYALSLAPRRRSRRRHGSHPPEIRFAPNRRRAPRQIVLRGGAISRIARRGEGARSPSTPAHRRSRRRVVL